MVFFTTPELLEIGDIPMTSLNEKPVRAEALKYYRRVAEHYKLDIRQYQRVERIAGEDGAFVTHCTDAQGCPHQYASKKVILSTGYYDVPNLLNVPGEDLPKVIHYYKEAHPYYNHDVLVVGAKNSAASPRWSCGGPARASPWCIAAGEIHRHVKYWIKPNIENRIKNGEIPAYFHSRVVEIGERSARIATPDGEMELKNDFVFAMTGYQPDTQFLEAHGIQFDPQTQAAVHQSGYARKRPQGNVPGGRAGGGDAHQRDFHRERPLPRQDHRGSDCQSTGLARTSHNPPDDVAACAYACRVETLLDTSSGGDTVFGVRASPGVATRHAECVRHIIAQKVW